MIGLGIDTGGTCTDAVIYDIDHQKVLSTAKVLTTKERLETGIENAISALDGKTLKDISFVSLSTTLATNACVENRGSNVKLLFIGVKENVVRENYQAYGFESMDDIIFIDGIPEGGYCKPVEPDWNKLIANKEQFVDAQAIGIVQYFPEWNHGAFEKKAKEILSQFVDVQIVCGSELFSDLNAIRRGAGTYLNVRLIPIIRDFIRAVKHVLSEYALNVPIYIVRSDGTLMNEEFTMNHPVETLLCGPAASAVGGAWMTKEENAMIIDIGGTTTDIALLKNGVPVTVEDGIKINGWRTFVKGIFIDTLGLGGDSAVHYGKTGIYLEGYRVIPLSMVTDKYPQLLNRLKKVVINKKKMSVAPYEGFVLQKKITNQTLSPLQKKICEMLTDGPMLCAEVLDVCTTTNYKSTISRLERENIVMRFGITPTDIMHVNGDYTDYCVEGAECGIRLFSIIHGIESSQIVTDVYESFYQKLYSNIVRVLIEQQSDLYQEDLSDDVKRLILEMVTGKFEMLDFIFQSNIAFVGIGGPAHIFMRQLEQKFHSKVYIHENAKVANAIGTLAGKVSVKQCIEINYCSEDDAEGFRVYVDGKKMIIEDFDEAVKVAKEYLHKMVLEIARLRGAIGELVYNDEIEKYGSTREENTLLLGAKITTSCYGGI